MLFATVMALPLVVFLFMLRSPARPQPSPAPRLLDRLREQGFLDYGSQHDTAVPGEMT
jgi:hypothetical protein